MLIAWMTVIFLLSHQPKEDSEKTSHLAMLLLQWLHIDLHTMSISQAQWVIRKSAHITEYFILFRLAIGVVKEYVFPVQRAILYTLLGCILYAASDEFHQWFIPGRGACVQDVAIDSIGVLLSATLFYIFGKRKSTNLPS